MNRHITYCTEAQTKKALNLGAPLEIGEGKGTILCRLQNYHTYKKCVIPTAEQMIGWLEEQGMNFTLTYNPFDEVKIIITKCGGFDEIANIKWNKSKKTAVIAAIDAALEYLEKIKQ